ncbi:nifB protein NifB [Methanocaldococcus villosus KIN24-T80]|uniref:FeMo cofactor biosynthesis protein NifB n=2 Tax=Methanocaldococcus villosus TaxID=667126 RepID=N6VZV3_9EURY|nr:nifB protein NifB [Methanocaldococcus villosus KIN24-T80]
MSKFAHITKIHPCFNEKIHDKVGRIHLPVALKCNIACKFCRRSIGKEACEQRPGVARAILKPEDVESYLKRMLDKYPNIKVVGIAGPGDSLFNKETFETLKIIDEKFPNLIKCISTNGLLLPKYYKTLADLNVKTVTVTVNAINPEILKEIVERVYYNKKIYKGIEGAEILIKNQLEGIRKAYDEDLIIKINTVLIPEINKEHVVEIAKELKDYAYIQNIIPLIPLYKMKNYRPPTCEELKKVREEAEKYLPQFRACAQCRADAVGLIKEKEELKNYFKEQNKELDVFEIKHFSH